MGITSRDAIGTHHAVTGHFLRVRILVERIPHGTSGAGISRASGHFLIGKHAAPRDARDDGIDLFRKCTVL